MENKKFYLNILFNTDNMFYLLTILTTTYHHTMLKEAF
jgi:hypothetical protein